MEEEILPYDMLRLIFLFVASLESTSFRMDIVEMLSDLKHPSPFLQRKKNFRWINLNKGMYVICWRKI